MVEQKAKGKIKRVKAKENNEDINVVEELIENTKDFVADKRERTTKKKKIDLNEEIEVINFTSGNLFYRSPKTGRRYDFAEFGSSDFMTVDELKTMLSAHPTFLRAPWLLVLDSNIVEYLGLTKLYENIKTPEQIDRIFGLSASELKPVLNSLPVGMKPLIVGRALIKIKNEELDSRLVIKLLEETYNVKLVETL